MRRKSFLSLGAQVNRGDYTRPAGVVKSDSLQLSQVSGLYNVERERESYRKVERERERELERARDPVGSSGIRTVKSFGPAFGRSVTSASEFQARDTDPGKSSKNRA